MQGSKSIPSVYVVAKESDGESSHGVVTVKNTLSVQDYFTHKMAAKKERTSKNSSSVSHVTKKGSKDQ